MERSERVRRSWRQSNHIYLTLDLECDYGTALSKNTYQSLAHVSDLAELLDEFEIPLTCFVQTEVLCEHPEAVSVLRDATPEVAFHPHSHTHRPRRETDMKSEIARSTDQFRSFFGTSPTGYRIPNGNVSPGDYAILADHGYEFDASVFPTWRPFKFDNRTQPNVPTYYPEYDLFELPFTVFSSHVPVPTSLAYYLLFGRLFEALLHRRPPTPMVFNIHMHDLVKPQRFHDLPRRYRMAYARTDRGLDTLERFLRRFSGLREFALLDNLTDIVGN